MKRFFMTQNTWDRIFDTHHVYHIDKVKVGCTNDLESRVTEQQGYKEGEYDVITSVDNIFIASFVEMNEQSKRRLPKDNEPYYMLFSSTRDWLVKPTNGTIGFPARTQDELRELLNTARIAIGGLEFEIPLLGNVKIDSIKKINWIVDNAKESFINAEPGTYAMPMFVKNKLLWNAMQEFDNEVSLSSEDKWSVEKIAKWHEDKGILAQSNAMHQAFKISEEYGELAAAMIKDQGLDKIEDALGDMFVVMVSVAILNGTDLNTCIQRAWNEIKDRPGKMVGADFRKEVK